MLPGQGATSPNRSSTPGLTDPIPGASVYLGQQADAQAAYERARARLQSGVGSSLAQAGYTAQFGPGGGITGYQETGDPYSDLGQMRHTQTTDARDINQGYQRQIQGINTATTNANQDYTTNWLQNMQQQNYLGKDYQTNTGRATEDYQTSLGRLGVQQSDLQQDAETARMRALQGAGSQLTADRAQAAARGLGHSGLGAQAGVATHLGLQNNLTDNATSLARGMRGIADQRTDLGTNYNRGQADYNTNYQRGMTDLASQRANMLTGYNRTIQDLGTQRANAMTDYGNQVSDYNYNTGLQQSQFGKGVIDLVSGYGLDMMDAMGQRNQDINTASRNAVTNAMTGGNFTPGIPPKPSVVPRY